MRQRLRVVAALLAVGAVAGGCSTSPDALSVVEAAAEAQVPTADIPDRDASLTTASWDQVAAWASREVADGRPVVINLFASWCGPCKAEAPLIRQAVDNHPEVAFLLVDHLDRMEAGRAFLRDEDLTDVPSVFDDAADVAGALQARGMPATAFFSASGELVQLVNGVLTEPVLAQLLADLEATIPDRP